MDIELICQHLYDEKQFRDKINSNYLSKDDFNVCDFIVNNTHDINVIPHKGKRISKRNAVKYSLEQFKNFSIENYERIKNIVNSVKFIKDFELYNSAVTTSYNVTSNNDNVKILLPGYISCYHLPRKIHDVDIVSLGHEHCHALKETNYLEHKNSLVLGEVIPIFYELINYEKNLLKMKHLEYRLYWVNEHKEIYLLLSNILNGNLKDNILFFMGSNIDDSKNMYEYSKCAYGCYLGGFYYALILYNIYKEDPVLILSLVNDVLLHKITTFEMLNKLNIYCDIKGEIFEEEIKNIKKVLSR